MREWGDQRSEVASRGELIRGGVKLADIAADSDAVGFRGSKSSGESRSIDSELTATSE